MSFRKLNQAEIAELEKRACTAADWTAVEVSEPFSPERFAAVNFSGSVRIGPQTAEASFAGGVKSKCGIYRTNVANSTFGANVYVAGVNRLANYDVADGAVIDNVGTLVVDGESTFGNGTEIEVFNEGGGRELKIFDRLSAQVAYMLVVYRHDAALIKQLNGLVDKYVESKKSARGTVGAGTRIENVTSVVNVAFGPAAKVSGATDLKNGTIASSSEDPTTVGAGVLAKSFIILSGSQVADGAVLANTFVGQGVKIGKQYSAENSTFFANCEGFHGEACSIFAGPYTVSHHKSTLMIAGMFSFYNAGSGTNQSNHMYKLGPIHQGILLRGAKTGSFSYMLWPSRVGGFSVVVGKHMTSFDAANLPFSYVQAVEEKTVITPAMNLFTVGTRRDVAKWPARDRRKDSDKLDLLNFDFFGPYNADFVMKGMADLKALYDTAPKEKEYVQYNGAQVARLMLRTGQKYYDMFVKIVLGECLIELLEASGGADGARAKLAEAAKAARPTWVDLAGLMAPADKVEALTAAIAAGKYASVADVQAELGKIAAAYPADKLRWFAGALVARGFDPAALANAQMAEIVKACCDNRVKLNNMILQDAQKEFDQVAMIGFGNDGDEAVKKADFEAIRGTYDGNKFVKEVKAESEAIAAKGAKLAESLK